MLFSIKLQPIDWRPVTLLENESYLAEAMKKNICGGVLFHEIAEMNSRPATLVKKASTKEVYWLLYKNFQRFYRKVSHELRFLIKIEGCVLQDCNLLRGCFTIDFFLKIVFLIQVIFGTYSKKNLC